MDIPADSPEGIVDMCDEELLRDPFGGYSRIRERAPLVRGAMPGVAPAWIVTRYDDVKMVLTDPRFVNDQANVPGMDVPSLSEQVLRSHKIPPEYLKYRLARMGLFDGADHARLRGLVSQAFTVRRVLALRPRVEEIVEGLLDRLPEAAEDGVVDLLRDFADPLPGMVMWELVGIPERDRPRWREWSSIALPGESAGKAAKWAAAIDYTRELIERRRAHPGDDLISAMIAAKAKDGDRLSETEMIAMIVMLGLTVPGTSGTFISNGIVALLTHPGQLALLRANPGLLPRAVHELLRWCGPSMVTARMRYATEDVEIGGMPVRKGEALWPMLVSANYDPRRFGDPARLDITRVPDRRSDAHVAFGGGPHLCLGAAQARQDAEVAFGALLRRYPGLRLAVDPAALERDPATQPFQWRWTALPVRL